MYLTSFLRRNHRDDHRDLTDGLREPLRSVKRGGLWRVERADDLLPVSVCYDDAPLSGVHGVALG